MVPNHPQIEMEQQPQQRPASSELIARDQYWRISQTITEEEAKNLALVQLLEKETQTLHKLRMQNNALKAKLQNIL